MLAFLVTIISILQMRRLSFSEVRIGSVHIPADVCIGSDYPEVFKILGTVLSFFLAGEEQWEGQ